MGEVGARDSKRCHQAESTPNGRDRFVVLLVRFSRIEESAIFFRHSLWLSRRGHFSIALFVVQMLHTCIFSDVTMAHTPDVIFESSASGSRKPRWLASLSLHRRCDRAYAVGDVAIAYARFV